MNLSTLKHEVYRHGGILLYDAEKIEEVCIEKLLNRNKNATTKELNELANKVNNLEMQIEILFDLIKNKDTE